MQTHRRPPDHDGDDDSTMTTHSSTRKTGPRTTWPKPPRRTRSWRCWPTFAPTSPSRNTALAAHASRWPIWSSTGALKVYTGFSARRFDSDVRDAHRKGFIGVKPAFNMVNRYIANPGLRSVITDLIERSAEPLSVVESYFAADGTGFSTPKRNARKFAQPLSIVRRANHQWGRAEVAASLAQVQAHMEGERVRTSGVAPQTNMTSPDVEV